MDALDRIIGVAGPLLARIDEIVEYAGAPEHHPVWTELRRVRLLPGDAVDAVAALRPEAVDEPALRSARDSLAEVATALPAAAGWDGPAADAYRAHRDGLAAQVEDLAARAVATAELGAEMADWMRAARRDVAAVLADVLSSGASVTVPAAGGGPVELLPPAQVDAAAQVAVVVLRTVGDAFAAAGPILDRSAELAAPRR
jgi:hypothetical protein